MQYFKQLIFIILFSQFKLYAQDKVLAPLDYYGEKIDYTLKAGFFQVGEVDIEFRGDSVGCGAYTVVNAKSTGIVDFIKNVQYRFDACMDTISGYTMHSTRIIKEGDFYDFDEVYYDRTSHPDSTIVITEDLDSIIVPKHIYDVLIAFFQFRKNYISHNMPIGEVVRMNTYFVDTEWNLEIKYLGKEKVDTKFGSVTCFKFKPRTEIGKYFKTNEDMTIWVTDNQYLIPVKFEVNLKFASLYADIVSYSKPYNKRKSTGASKSK